MKINKKISALLCSIAMCCSSGQVSKTSASVLGYVFSAAAVQQWVYAVSYYYSRFRSDRAVPIDSWFLGLLKPSKNEDEDEDENKDDRKGLIRAAKALSRFDNLVFPVVLTYLACEEFRKEKENNKRASNENMYVDPKNSKDKKSDTNK